MPNRCFSQVRCFGLIILFALVSLMGAPSYAQTHTQYDHGTPPQQASGVSSFGSYVSVDIGTVNLSNGSLNVRIPLGTIGGRGFSIPLTLNYTSKVWSASKDTGWDPNYNEYPVTYASYGTGEFMVDWHNRITPGWTVGAAPLLRMQAFGIQPLLYPGCGYARYLTKLTVSLPDRGEIELRDDYTDGAPHWARSQPNTGNCKWYDDYRGRRWHAADGSGAIFVSDSDNAIVNGNLAGVLITSDGLRYRFENTSPPTSSNYALAHCVSITDRNGNAISISYPSSSEVDFTDQLGRITKYQADVIDPESGQQLEVLVTLPGYGGQVRYYKVKSGAMSQNYRADINPALPVINGAHNPMNYYFFDQWWAGGTELFPESYCLFVERIDWQPVVNELILPDARSLRFKYNEFGEVAEIQLPTGGKVQYDYSHATALPSGVSIAAEVTTYTIPSNVSGIDRAITARRTFPDGATLEGNWSYIYQANSAQVRATSGGGTLMLDEYHSFLPSGRYIVPIDDGAMDGTGYSLWSTGLEWRTEIRDAAGAVMAATESDWSQRAPVSWWTGYYQEQPENDTRVNQQRKFLDTGLMAKVETLYDQYNNPTEVREYDYDQSLKRRTTTAYVTTNNGLNYATDDSIHLLRLPLVSTIYDGFNNHIAQTVMEYDVYTDDGDRGLLLDYTSVCQHDAAYGAGRATRGNATRTGNWLNTTGSFVYAFARYDTLGNVVSTKDPKQNVTSFSFADDFGDGSNPGGGGNNPTTPTFAFPTLMTSPPPSPGAPVHTARSQYDFSTGLLTGFRDRNGVVTQTIYNDPFHRPTLVKAAVGISGVENHTAMYYAPSSIFGITLTKNDMLTATDQSTLDDAALRSWTVTDGFGRTKESWSRDPQGNIKMEILYDALGRTRQTSIPFRPSAGETTVYKTTGYDLAGRIINGSTPDNAVVSTSYSGNTVTITDQTGKQRRSVTDALGRLVQVYEAPNNSSYNYLTSYTYDTLDNLVAVTQASQTRTFSYDSLKRLTSATGPETGTVSYQYDANDNLGQKTDARGVVSIYGYDALNRNITVSYSDGTPSVTRQYDNAVNGKGRLWKSYAGASQTAIEGYDALGRPLNQRQYFYSNGVWGTAYVTQRTYNLLGGVLSQTYPSGRTVSYSYDAAGRINSFTGTLGDGATRNYASSISYDSWNGIAREQFGTEVPLYHKEHRNVRGQLYDVRLSTINDDWNWNRGAVVNYYSFQPYGFGTSGPDNNGNLLVQQHWVPGDDGMSTYSFMQQNYDYDALNRISWIGEFQNGATPTGGQSYSYDRYGNRTISAASGLGISNQQFAVDANTNRLGVPPGQTGVMQYDANGNLINDTYSGAGGRVYDAENRMTSAINTSNQQSTFAYDADGRRVRRDRYNQEVWQVYGMDGELSAEYAANTGPSSPQKEYGYRNAQLLIIATAPAGWAANEPLSTLPAADTTESSASGTEPRSPAPTQLTTLLAANKLPDLLQWQGNGAAVGAISDTSTLLYDPSVISASLSSNLFLAIPQAGAARIAFASNRDGNAQIYLMNTDGTNQTRLTANAANDESPRWSPDGSRIVFQSDRDNPFCGVADIYVMNQDGSGQARLTSEANDDSAPVWSPDGTKIAFQSARNGTNYQVYVMNADGNGQVNISNSSANDGQPSWSPDGTKIAFTSDRDHPGSPSVYVMNANGNNQTRLTFIASAFRDEQPAWSPNGAKLAFASTRDSIVETWQETDDEGGVLVRTAVRVNKEVYVMNADGSNQMRLTNSLGNDDSPAWSRDGTQIGFRSDRDRECCDPTQQVWVMNADGSSQVNLSNNEYGDLCPSWQQTAVNVPPTVSLTNPAEGSGFTTPANITITANAADSDGSIGRVDFYQGTTLIGASTANPYTVSWSNVPPGNYSLTAKATDNLGASTISTPVTITVSQPATSADIRWLVSDQLGTPRMIVDQSGSLANVSRHDYLPFGEELTAGVGGRTTAQGYGNYDGVRQRFTSKERDDETGLDYFGARYYASTQGRFTSPDPLLSSGRIYDPQTWNRYSYTLNNPLKYIDPTGLYEFNAALGGSATDDELTRRAGNDKKALKGAERIIGQRNQFRTALAGAAAKSGDLTASQQQAVARAVNAYGTENDGNQVVVGFGRTGTGVGANTDGRDMSDYIYVAFNAGHKGNDLIIDVAHEGSHVADNQDFNDTHGMYGFGGPTDISQYETERRAYEVSSFVAQAVGKGSYPNNLEGSSDSRKQQVWNSGWRVADRETKRSAGIDRLISTYYGVTKNKSGWTFGGIKERVP